MHLRDSTARASRRSALLWCAGAALLALSACTAGAPDGNRPTDGDPATWELAAPGQVTAESSTLDIEVTRLACASGRTGEVLEPKVAYDTERIVIQVDVEPLDDRAYMCPSNDAVPVTVTLDEPVGERDLVDGACLDGEAAMTSICEDPTRRPSS